MQKVAEYGTAVFATRLIPGRDPGVYCIRADPTVRIASELVTEWHETKVPDGRGGWTAITLLRHGASVLLRCTGHPECLGDLITMDCADRRLVYRITGLDFAADTYFAEWPD